MVLDFGPDGLSTHHVSETSSSPRRILFLRVVPSRSEFLRAGHTPLSPRYPAGA